ncbi:MAG: hypothetical protein VKJ04_09115 [Vampirovibrionales bacterium]|nr:hypothetical protein [Vampirovibrionales bacterium]
MLNSIQPDMTQKPGFIPQAASAVGNLRQPAQTHSDHKAKGSYRFDVPYTAALKSENAHGLGSYRHDIQYTAALKSDNPMLSSHQGQGTYRHDIKYAAALKSSLPVGSASQTLGMQNPQSQTKGANPTNDLKFAGANRVLAPVLFSAPFITALSALNNANSMFAIAARDAFDSSGRIVQEVKRNPHGGRESFLEELGTTLVWGFGIPLSRKLYDWTVGSMSRGGKGINVQFPGIDPHLLEDRTSAHKLTPEMVEKYFKNIHNVPAHEFESQKKQLLALANIPEGLGKNGQVMDKAAQQILNKYRGNLFLKLILCTFIPVLGIGFAIPKANQWLTHRIIHKEKTDSLQSLHQQELSNNPFHASNILRMSGQPGDMTHLLRMAGRTDTPAPVSTDAASIKFGGAMTTASNWVGRMLTNDQAMSLNFVDAPLSSGRVITARNKDERIERAYREAWIIFTLFFLQTWLQQVAANLLDKMFKTSSSDIGFKSLKALHQSYQSIDKAGDKAVNKDQKFLADYARLKQELGVSGRLSQWIPGTENPKLSFVQRMFYALREKFTGYYPVVELTREQKAQQAKVLETIREYFAKPEASPNLLFDLAEKGGHVPTLKSKGAAAQKGHIDITRKIDDASVKQLAGYLDHLAHTVGEKGVSLDKALLRTNGVKASAFALSAMFCWGVVSYFVPKTMHAITFWRTGKDEFPGIKGL